MSQEESSQPPAAPGLPVVPDDGSAGIKASVPKTLKVNKNTTPKPKKKSERISPFGIPFGPFSGHKKSPSRPKTHAGVRSSTAEAALGASRGVVSDFLTSTAHMRFKGSPNAQTMKMFKFCTGIYERGPRPTMQKSRSFPSISPHSAKPPSTYVHPDLSYNFSPPNRLSPHKAPVNQGKVKGECMSWMQERYKIKEKTAKEQAEREQALKAEQRATKHALLGRSQADKAKEREQVYGMWEMRQRERQLAYDREQKAQRLHKLSLHEVWSESAVRARRARELLKQEMDDLKALLPQQVKKRYTDEDSHRVSLSPSTKPAASTASAGDGSEAASPPDTKSAD